MRRSKLFIKTRREAPADEAARNAQLLIRAGYVHKEMAGVYSYLPLGLAVIEKIKQVVREEMDAIGGEEMLLSTLQAPHIWQSTDRWADDKVDVWFKTALGQDSSVGLAWSHEEPMGRIMTQYVDSYKDLPIYSYQFQTKLRKELRAKSGLLRGREFIMKDLYSFCKDRQEHEAFYERVSQAYLNVYKRLAIGDITYKTFASGGPFSKFSHEFQTISPIGEDIVYLHEQKKLAINKEVLRDNVLAELGLKKSELVEKTAVEVGNIFTFGARYSEPLGLFYADAKGVKQPVFMGSYGIGISRLMGLLAEHFADERGLIWPSVIAPFDICLVRLGESEHITKQADAAYQRLTSEGVAVLYDDRIDASIGEKLNDADLLGIPMRLVVSDKTVTQKAYELKRREETEAKLITLDKLKESLANTINA
jgi:prolyl-tRNA synthetase